MKLIFINGSPKGNAGASYTILKALENNLNTEEISWINPLTQTDQDNQLVLETDAIVFSLPLYVDSLPSHFISYLLKLETLFKTQEKAIKVYAIVNCGFYEGKQAHIALAMLQDWTLQSKLTWGQGIGLGGGAMIEGLSIGKGPLKQLGITLTQLSTTIQSLNSEETLLLNPTFPKLLYKTAAHSGFNQAAKRNGLKKAQIRTRLINQEDSE